MLVGHNKAVVSCKFKPRDGSRIVSAGADSTAKIWNVDSGECTATLSGHSQGICDVAWSSRGTYLCTASDDQTLKIWVSMSLLHMQLACMHPVAACLTRHPSLPVSLQDAETGKALRTLRGHTSYVFCCSFHPHDHLLVRLPRVVDVIGPCQGNLLWQGISGCKDTRLVSWPKSLAAMLAYRHPGRLMKP